MIDFVQKQLEASERLFNMMMQDHKERMQQTVVWADMNAGLIKKLEERDATIQELRAKLAQYETAEKV
jgi:type II secretory pathway component PulF